MTSTKGITRLAIRFGSLAVLCAAWLLPASAAPAEAHGKELTITVTSLIPDARQPLVRLYRVEVVHAGDLDPVEDGTVLLSATLLRDGAPLSVVGPVQLVEVEGGKGIYVAEVTYDRFGSWEVSLHVEAALGQGAGDADFVEELSPGALSSAAEAALRAEGERVYRLQLFFSFDWWPDVVNIALRIIHSMAGLAYFLVTGAALALAWFGAPAGRPELPSRLARVFPPLAFGSLAALLAAGLYSAAFDAPIVAPGIYDVRGMLRIPYGEWYLAAFLVKPVLFVVLTVLAFRIHRTLRTWRSGPIEAGDAPHPGAPVAIARLRRLTTINAAAGLLLVVDVAVVIYLHYISHLGVFLPE